MECGEKGHICQRTCHPLSSNVHGKVKCSHTVPFPCPRGDHTLTRECREDPAEIPCKADRKIVCIRCQQLVTGRCFLTDERLMQSCPSKMSFSCGSCRSALQRKCWEEESAVKCTKLIEWGCKACGTKRRRQCHQPESACESLVPFRCMKGGHQGKKRCSSTEQPQCDAPCCAPLACGHPCQGRKCFQDCVSPKDCAQCKEIQKAEAKARRELEKEVRQKVKQNLEAELKVLESHEGGGISLVEGNEAKREEVCLLLKEKSVSSEWSFRLDNVWTVLNRPAERLFIDTKLHLKQPQQPNTYLFASVPSLQEAKSLSLAALPSEEASAPSHDSDRQTPYRFLSGQIDLETHKSSGLFKEQDGRKSAFLVVFEAAVGNVKIMEPLSRREFARKDLVEKRWAFGLRHDSLVWLGAQAGSASERPGESLRSADNSKDARRDVFVLKREPQAMPRYIVEVSRQANPASGFGVPPYWTRSTAVAPTGDGGRRSDTFRGFHLIPVKESDKAVRKALQSALDATPSGFLGKGRDQMVGGRYSRLELACAWRIENRRRWQIFDAERQTVRENCAAVNRTAEGVFRPADINANLVEACKSLPCASTLRQREANEFLLWHGTKKEVLLSLLQQGLNERFNKAAAFGPGTYFAEDAGKSDQYVSAHSSFDPSGAEETILYKECGQKKPEGDVFYIFLCRVLMGVFVSGNSSAFTNQNELQFIPETSPPLRHHCLLAGGGGGFRYREIIQPHGSRIYAEYLIAYQRR
uniref:Poly [ADP-ribose] polymerase n=1 Tax=Chromera velia CCMP2878 TaxID=1169474 RepID=A0A0G4HTC2_9ALVE|eukprot:Cvel_8439.t1-p1 / transcript=Cvel_8439.t1 / gene=Cvel_8439 / organism=Chromera_velia_CCMP2878 / gene_product=NFX1-type zinc finger-containing protein 1, putative / transcript_product=NFX1-type zinc finger-containing protein 1, putative / location=Cvel_scaffold466:18749-21007(-) / protein_length=753 / sequence_SO=supercontig / SO=protein_coding / is_pseudo=false